MHLKFTILYISLYIFVFFLQILFESDNPLSVEPKQCDSSDWQGELLVVGCFEEDFEVNGMENQNLGI